MSEQPTAALSAPYLRSIRSGWSNSVDSRLALVLAQRAARVCHHRRADVLEAGTTRIALAPDLAKPRRCPAGALLASLRYETIRSRGLFSRIRIHALRSSGSTRHRAAFSSPPTLIARRSPRAMS